MRVHTAQSAVPESPARGAAQLLGDHWRCRKVAWDDCEDVTKGGLLVGRWQRRGVMENEERSDGVPWPIHETLKIERRDAPQASDAKVARPLFNLFSQLG
jgi:hypothetical protein